MYFIALQVAAVMPGEEHEHLDVIIHLRAGGVQRINPNHRSYDALHYVLLMPYGDDGWTPGLKGLSGKTISISQFYAFHLQIRAHCNNTMLGNKKLSHQYVVDMMAKVERARMQFIKDHQGEIKADKYKGLVDAKDRNDLPNAGRTIILPPSVTSSPRWYVEKLHDMLAIVRRFGKPTLFITQTCNPLWKEITDSLEAGETWHDRPDLCARVFKAKLEMMMSLLLKDRVLGEVVYYVYTIEWQKRKGLPHAHLLIKLAEEPRTSEEIDKIISAEIPSKEDKILLERVKTHMIHGPCGNLNPNCPCMEHVGESTRKECSKNYPMNFSKETMMDESSFPAYRRRAPEEGGETFMMPRGDTIDNRWVVPYNPFLLMKMDCHVNVVLISSVIAVKYVFKYQHKGPDRVLMRLEDCNNSEVEQYITGRYLSTSESWWKFLSFDITKRSHGVVKLPCHLENEQQVFFKEGEEEDALERGMPVSMLTAWFEANKTNEGEATSYTYSQFPEYFVFNKKDKEWNPRVRNFGETIGRIPSIPLNPRTMELYSLRLILHNKKGSTSFEELRTVDEKVMHNFQSAAIAMGLLDDDKELDKAMDEAYSMKFGDAIRVLFLQILLNSKPSDPLKFYLDHKDKLTEDWNRDRKHRVEAENKFLLWLEDRLLLQEMDLDSFHLPQPDREMEPLSKEEAVMREELNYNTDTEAAKTKMKLEQFNDEQMEFFEAVIEDMNSKEPGGMFLLDAPGGTGKSFVNNCLLSAVRQDGYIAIATALSAVASKLLDGGTTLHSRMKIPIDIKEDSLCNFNKNTAVGKLVTKARLLIIDEVSMGHKHNYEALDRSLRKARGIDKPMGGLCTIFAGDWRQTLPIIQRASEGQIVNACLKNSYLWDHMKVFHLTENMRVKVTGSSEAEAYSKWLLDVGNGTCGEGELTIPEAMMTEQETLESLTDSVFPNLSQRYVDTAWMAERAILAPTNKEVDEVNNYIIQKIPGEQIDFMSIDSTEDGSTEFTPEFLNTIEISGLPPHLLKIKKGAMVILLRNMDAKNGHCNGTKYVVQNIRPHVLELRAINGTNIGAFLLLPRIISITKTASLPFVLRRKQFPLKLAFALSANKVILFSHHI